MRIEQRKRLGITAHHGAGQRAAAPGTRRNGAARRAGAHHCTERPTTRHLGDAARSEIQSLDLFAKRVVARISKSRI